MVQITMFAGADMVTSVFLDKHQRPYPVRSPFSPFFPQFFIFLKKSG
jgi:hypothetical protein